MSKERQQVVILGVVLVIIVGVLVYFYRDALLPHPTGQATVAAPPARMTVPNVNAKALFNRDDFSNLQRFGDVPVQAPPGPGSQQPFVNQPLQ